METVINSKTPLRSLKSCHCGGRPKLERESGWWHIECKKCHKYPIEMQGCMRIWGWMSRRAAMAAWQKSADVPERMLADKEAMV